MNISCNFRLSCTGLAVVASIIVGIITAILRITGVITLTSAFLWVALGIAVVYLALLLVSTALRRRNRCCAALGALLIGILGTILLSVVLLAVAFATTSILGAIITGLLLAFASLIFTATACYINCSTECDE